MPSPPRPRLGAAVLLASPPPSPPPSPPKLNPVEAVEVVVVRPVNGFAPKPVPAAPEVERFNAPVAAVFVPPVKRRKPTYITHLQTFPIHNDTAEVFFRFSV